VSGKFPGNVTPGKITPINNKYEAGWAPELAWTFWKIEQLAPPGIEPKSSIPVAQSLYQLSYPSYSCEVQCADFDIRNFSNISEKKQRKRNI